MTSIEQKASEYAEIKAPFRLSGKDKIRADFLAGAAARQPEVDALVAEVDRLNALVNNPHTKHFLESVQLEAAHQQERWGSSHDAGKADSDWFWLIGYLAGKAIRPEQTQEKRLHHIITSAAACLNWHAHVVGYRDGATMRPGINPEQVKS